MNVLLVGAGGMSADYAKVLSAMNVPFEAVCRSEIKAKEFSARHNVTCLPGGVERYLEQNETPSHAIVAVGVDGLDQVTRYLISRGVKNILVEKPAALYQSEIDNLTALSNEKDVSIYVAYNRRYYQSVQMLVKMAEEDGGLTSLHFDFTEWSDRIAPLEKGDNVKERWVLSNSTHVIDLAFYLAGAPLEMHSHTQGKLKWHDSAARFFGSGLTDRGVAFTYRADWDAPGRWGVTAYTRNYKFDLCPLEELYVTDRNKVVPRKIDLDNNVDIDFKPGLYLQVEVFLTKPKNSNLCSLTDHQAVFSQYADIAGYRG
ncbi:MAG: Gfo/Idh/MocA family protein [Neptuniibacter sp.]